MRAKPMGDAGASLRIQTAVTYSVRLLYLVKKYIRTRSQVTIAENDWSIASHAMILGASDCLESIVHLGTMIPLRREQDATVLCRRLYEYVLDLAWIAIDPSKNLIRWISDYYSHRLELEEELNRDSVNVLSEETRTRYAQLAKSVKKLPKIVQRSEQADKYWSQIIEDHGRFPGPDSKLFQSGHVAEGGSWSFRSIYGSIYREGSATVHPTPMSLQSYINGAGSETPVIGFLSADVGEDDYSYTTAPLLFALMLLISHNLFGLPPKEHIISVFEGVSK